MALIFGVGLVTPRRAEEGMTLAARAAVRSACLSRQVGAAILDRDGRVIATGCNDVPKSGGGLYTSESKKDERCWSRGSKCYNDQEKRLIAEELSAAIKEACSEESVGLSAEQLACIEKCIASSRIRGLIEFSRAVHAEMDALITIARLGGSHLAGATLYSTTYPCHNCAKHIIASGIEKVVYLEPYEKSLARKLHGDSINDTLTTDPSKVSFSLYNGVAPRRYDSFFVAARRKKDGIFLDRDRQRGQLIPKGSQSLEVLRERLKDIEKQISRNHTN